MNSSAAVHQAAHGVAAARAYRAIFRLHFYAGLIVAPFLLLLSVTGIVYLFNTEIDDALHPSWRFTDPAGVSLPAERIVDGALAAYPGAKPTRVDFPTEPGRTAVVFLKAADDAPFRVYVDPVTGIARGHFTERGSLVGAAGLLHGSLLMGDRGERVLELMSCWAIVLIATGLYLWWPRTPQRVFGVFVPRLNLRGRPLWRDLHAVAGVWGSLLLLFLLLSGLPWASHWGRDLNRAMAAAGIGYPASYRTHTNHGAGPVPAANDGAPTLGQTTPGVPWTLEQAPAPRVAHVHGADATLIGVGEAARIFAGLGLVTAYRLSYPKDAHDVYTGYTYPDQPQGQRTVQLDPYTGEVLNDVRFADYGVGAQAVELGVQLHMGNYFGLPNQLLMLFAALMGAGLAISGPAMWLSRRREGLGAPPPLTASGPVWGLIAGLMVLGLIFPTLGLSLIGVFALERGVLRHVAPVRDCLGLAR